MTPGPPARAMILLAEQIRALVERRPPPAELSRNPTLLRSAIKPLISAWPAAAWCIKG